MHPIRTLLGLLAAATLAACTVAPTTPAASTAPAPTAPPGWTLVWNDEFDGTQLDRSKWDHDLGTGFWAYDAHVWVPGWGNRELQYYTREPENVFVKDGLLHLRAVKEAREGAGYTSGRLSTRKRDGGDLFSKIYGRFEFRAKLPLGQGLWPALWLLPRDSKYGGWPASGEIDVMEARGQAPTKVQGTAHFDRRFAANAVASQKIFEFPQGQSIADFHVYALEWEPGVLRWLVDGQVFRTQTFWWSASKLPGDPKTAGEVLNPWPAPFDQPFYLIMNLAVGGNFLGNPDQTTPFPAEMLVDYVRVYDKVGGYGPVPPRGEGSVPALQQAPVKVLSYNIRCGSCEKPTDVNHWSRRKFLVADVIRQSGADLIGLQEAELFQVKDLVALLAEYDWVGVGRDDGKEQGESNAVLVRRKAWAIETHKTLWLSETPDKVSRGWDAALNRTVTVLKLKSPSSGKELHFLNTHFDHMGQQARRESAQLIAHTVRSLGETVPVILTGDFNDRPGVAAYRTLAGSLLDAALASRTPTQGGDITFNNFGKDIEPGNKIDYVFVSQGQEVRSHRVITDLRNGLYPSDHFPIAVEVGLR